MDLNKERLGKLTKYLPFMDYIVEKTEYEHREKYGKMRNWIIKNKTFQKESLVKFEKSIIVSYRELCNENGFPEDLHKIFVVDLCSDNDDESSTISAKTTKKDETTNPLLRVLPKDNEKSSCISTPKETEIVSIISDNEDDDIQIVDVVPARPVQVPVSNRDSSSPIFFRRNNLMTKVKNAKNESSYVFPVLHKRKKKHKKDKRSHKKKLKKMTSVESTDDLENVQLFGQNTSSKLGADIFETMDASELLEIKQKIMKEINNLSDINKSIEIGNLKLDTIKTKSIKELTDMKDDLIQKMGIDGNTKSLLENFDIMETQTLLHEIEKQISPINDKPKTGEPTVNVVPMSSLPSSISEIPQPMVIIPLGETSYRVTTSPSSIEDTLQIRDPRVQKLLTHGQYIHNRVPDVEDRTTTKILKSTSIQNATPPLVLPTPTAANQCKTLTSNDTANTVGNNKKRISYDEYHRNILERKKLSADAKRLKEEEVRCQEEIVRLEKIKADKEAKLQEELAAKRQTEQIKDILNKHKDDIAEILSKDLLDSTLNQENKTPEKDNNSKKTSNGSNWRCLKELECTLKGFDTLQDYIPRNPEMKRHSSLSARKAIAEQFYTLNNVEDIENKHAFKRRKQSTDSFYTTETLCMKRRSSNQNLLPKVKQCHVVLTRLTESQILRLTGGHVEISNKDSNVKASHFKNRSSDLQIANFALTAMDKQSNSKDTMTQVSTSKSYVAKSVKNKIVLRNIDCCMTERNCKTCAICNKSASNLTNHFVRLHKTESYVSRLTWEELDELQLNIPFAEEVLSTSDENRSRQYKIDCPFCPVDKQSVQETFPNLRRHYSGHTGEYAFQCKNCGLQKPFRENILSHQGRTKCVNAGINVLYQYPSGQMVVYMYICNICNFVQLNKANVYKHLRDQHGKINQDPNYVKEYTLAAIKDGPIDRVALNTLPNIIETSENDVGLFPNLLAEVSAVVVSNEAMLDENFNTTINVQRQVTPNNKLKEENTNLDCAVKDECIWDNETTEGENLSSNPDLLVETTPNEPTNIKLEVDCIADCAFNNDGLFASPLKDHNIPQMNLIETDNIIERSESLLENKPDLETIWTESNKALLRKLTSDTGIQPDLLYQCPIEYCGGYFSGFFLWSKHMKMRHNSIVSTCCHCIAMGQKPETAEFSIESFEEHFKSHSQHLCLCFHCDAQFVDEEKLKDHGKNVHTDILELRLECIPYNLITSYYILVDKILFPGKLEFLIQLNEVLKNRIQRIENAIDLSDKLSTSWSSSYSTSWLENLFLPIFNTKISKKNCMYPKCRESFQEERELLCHLKAHNVKNIPYTLNCMMCVYVSKPGEDWSSVVNHYFLHCEDIFLCCVCSYYSWNKKNISNHIQIEHDKRDVPVLYIRRSTTEVKVQLEFVFASGTRTFTTTKNCFCGCGETNLDVEKFVTHLRREHFLQFFYYCEYCDERQVRLQSSEEHHRLKHTDLDKLLKVRCQIACSKNRAINILSIRPLELRLSDENYNNASEKFVDLYSVNKTVSTVKIKREYELDNELMVLEDDEVVAADEAKKKDLQPVASTSLIVCKSLSQLAPHYY